MRIGFVPVVRRPHFWERSLRWTSFRAAGRVKVAIHVCRCGVYTVELVVRVRSWGDAFDARETWHLNDILL